MRNWKTLLASVLVASMGMVGSAALAQDEPAAPPTTDFPRNETLIIQNPENPAKVPGWFNNWVLGQGGGTSTGLHQLVFDTLWFIDPDAGLDGSNYNQLAAEPAAYNADFTEITVKLRQGILWSDGVEFTSDDVRYTVETQMADPGYVMSARVLDNDRHRRDARQIHGASSS